MAANSSISEIAERYAKALFDLADQDKLLDVVADDLRALKAALSDSDDLTRLIRSPVLSRAQQGAALGAMLEKAGASALVQKFIGLVAANRRLFALPKMIDAYLTELATRRGEVTAYVTSSHVLDDGQLAALNDAIKAAVGAKVTTEIVIDPSLISGLIVRVGSRMVDASLRTKLDRMRLQLKAA